MWKSISDILPKNNVIVLAQGTSGIVTPMFRRKKRWYSFYTDKGFIGVSWSPRYWKDY